MIANEQTGTVDSRSRLSAHYSSNLSDRLYAYFSYMKMYSCIMHSSQFSNFNCVLYLKMKTGRSNLSWQFLNT